MARKDEILTAFLSHPIVERKYKVNKDILPITVREGLQSSEPIIKCIALIVENLEGAPITDNSLRTIITTYLDKAAI